jgi:hypothetical protein
LEKTLKEKEEKEAEINEQNELSSYRSKHRIEDLEEELKDAKTQ